MIGTTEPSPAAVHPWVAEGQRTVRYGLLANTIGGDWGRLREETQLIEELGYDSTWVFDHPVVFGSSDCWVTLTMLASMTKKLRLGSFVSCIFYRHPAVLARMAADVDQISNGRLVLGVGIGDLPEEFEQLNLPYLSTRERQQALSELVQIVRGLWDNKPFLYQGHHFQVKQASGQPHPIQQPYVPLLIAGGGEQRTLRQVARYADMANFGPHVWTGSSFSREDAVRKYAALRLHAQSVERPYDAILRSYYTPSLTIAPTLSTLQAKLVTFPIPELSRAGAVFGTPEEVTAHYQSLVDVGVQYFIVGVAPGDTETLQLLAQKVMPALHLPPIS
jgi:alkanesulfonate monooxygenase SsuD/methylene tetrahydromethanopterin reductase-like flavin-dependent oxidoreductase (luciferase family)